jgi:hypothetical protein
MLLAVGNGAHHHDNPEYRPLLHANGHVASVRGNGARARSQPLMLPSAFAKCNRRMI